MHTMQLVAIITTNSRKKAKSTKWGYKRGRPRRDLYEEVDDDKDFSSRRNDCNYREYDADNDDDDDNKSNDKLNDYADSNNRKCNKNNQHEKSTLGEHDDALRVGLDKHWANNMIK